MTASATSRNDRRAARFVLVAITLIALLAGWAVHRHAWIAAAGSAAMLAIGVGWPRLSVRGLDATLDLGVRRVRQGESSPLELRLRNRLPLPSCDVDVHVRDIDSPLVVPALGPWRRRPATLALRASRRGVVDLGSAVAVCSFPFGLTLATRVLGWRGELVVWPRRGAGAFPLPRRTPSSRDEAAQAARAAGGDELGGIRPYRAGDPMRHLHWKATARHDRLISREAHDGPRPPARIVLDLSAPDDDACERAITRAAGAAEHYLGLGFHVEVMVAARVLVPAAAPGPAGLERTLDALARLALADASLRASPMAATCANATLVVAAGSLLTEAA